MDYQGNSNKAKEEAAEAEAAPDKHLVKVISGEVVERKKPFGHKFKTVFFGGEFKEVVGYVWWDVMLPGARNIFFDTIQNAAYRAVFGNRGAPPPMFRPGPSQNRPPIVNYNNPVRRFSDPRNPLPQQPTGRLPQQPPTGYKQNRREANDVILESKADAELALETLIACVEQYGVASLADLYELIGLPSSPIDHKWGWTTLTSSPIKQIREGYLLELPPLEEI